MNKLTYISLSLLCMAGFCNCEKQQPETYVQYVDTRVGTAAATTKQAGRFGKGSEEYAQTLPAVLEPNGMNFWTAQTRDTEKKCIAPYYYADTLLQGFRNSHWIVGGCTQDYGSMTLMPISGTLKCQPANRASFFTHDHEIATPAYYAVELADYNIYAEMTGKSRSAVFRITYRNEEDAYLVVNPNSDEGEGFIEVDIANKEIRGYNPVHRIYQGWGEYAGFNGYFIIRFDTEIEQYGTFEEEEIYSQQAQIANRKNIGAFVKLKIPADRKVLVKVSSSFTGFDGARKNLNEEIAGWDFEQVQTELVEKWNRTLGVIDVKTSNVVDKRKFYSALYRSSFLPRTFNDVDGSYPGFSHDTTIHRIEKGNYYDDFSMWDTYRALHPLLNIIAPQKSGEMMQSLALKYQQGGWLPIFPCWNSYTAAMIGDHCTSVLADAYIKGIRNFDVETAYEGARKNAFELPDRVEDYKNGMGRRALTSYLTYGYIPLEDSVPDAFHTKEQVSRTLEYAYDDFALAQWAKALAKEQDAVTLYERSKNYKHIMDPATGYARGKYTDGRFVEVFDPFNFASFITEGTPAHYSWYVPHDVKGLIEIMGGREKYLAKLDSMFTEGLYWHGNEPCHQVAYMFNYAGQPWRTQKEVRHVMETEYLDAPGGLSGNDDAGQMSAWYVFASLGFYPVCPASPYYMIASPSFDEAGIHLENGKIFTISAHNASPENVYIQSAMLNGEKYTRNYLLHDDIMRGGTLTFIMGPEPNKEWGSRPADCLIENIKD